jgi:hypothetical protein
MAYGIIVHTDLFPLKVQVDVGERTARYVDHGAGQCFV